MDIDKIYDLAEELQIQNNDVDLGEIVDAVLKGAAVEVTYEKITRIYSYSETQFNKYLM